jgi:SAM-dependent methyltransferase
MSGFLQTLKQFVSPGGIEGYFAIQCAEFAKNTEDMRDEYRRLAAAAAGEIQDGKVLEIGSGPGYISIELAKLLPGAEFVGLDISETMIEIARENAREYGLAKGSILGKGMLRTCRSPIPFLISSSRAARCITGRNLPGYSARFTGFSSRVAKL